MSAAEPDPIPATSFWRAARWAAERLVRLTAGVCDVFYGTAPPGHRGLCDRHRGCWWVHRIDQIMGAGASLTSSQLSERCVRLTSQWAAVVVARP